MLPSYSFLAGQQSRNLSHSEVTLSAENTAGRKLSTHPYSINESLPAAVKEANSVHAQFALNKFPFQIRSRSLENCTRLARAIKGNWGFITTELHFN